MNKQGSRSPESLALRRDGGLFIKALRTQAGLTQREIAVALNIKYYTMVAQMEAGTARIPPDHYTAYAKVLGVEPKRFTRKLMQYYDPFGYKCLWGNELLSTVELVGLSDNAMDNSKPSEAQAELKRVMLDLSGKSDEEITKVTNMIKAFLA